MMIKTSGSVRLYFNLWVKNKKFPVAFLRELCYTTIEGEGLCWIVLSLETAWLAYRRRLR